MNIDELQSWFNSQFGIDKPWPKKFEVDAITYAYCCQAIFDAVAEGNIRGVILGMNNGLIFNGVELILHKEKF